MNVFIIAATSADGYIGLDEHHVSTSWTTTADRTFFVRKTKEAGVVVMGRKTFETIGRPLKGRRLIVYTSQPETIQISGVEATNEPPGDLLARLEQEGASAVAIAGGTSIYTLFVQTGLVNDVYLTIMPKMFGRGLRLFNADVDVNLQLLDTTLLDDNDSVLLHYLVH